MKISIFGLGYVGAVSLACLSRDGHDVIGVDIDRTKLDLIASGKTPVVEEGMVELMQRVAASGRVTVTTDARAAVRGSDISLVCVGTPSAANGSQDQGAILRLAREMLSCVSWHTRSMTSNGSTPSASHSRAVSFANVIFSA